MVLIHLGSGLNDAFTSGSCVHLIHTYNKNNGHFIPNVAIVGLDKYKEFYASPGGKPEKNELPHVTAAKKMLEDLSIPTTEINISLVSNKLNYIGSRLNLNGFDYTHHFVLNLVGYSTINRVYNKFLEVRYVPVVNMDATTTYDVHGDPLRGKVSGMNIIGIKAAIIMPMETIHISELE